MGDGLFSRTRAALAAPSANMTWTQLAGATVFVIVVAIAWRQVTHFIMGEV